MIGIALAKSKHMLTHLLFWMKPFICPGCEEPTSDTICPTCLTSMRKNKTMMNAKSDGILGVFPIFLSFSTTHSILVHWKNRGGNDLRNTLFSPSEDLIKEMKALHFDAIVGIPQYHLRNLKRGHASAMSVARFFSHQLSVPLIEDVLILNDKTGAKQAERNFWERKYLLNPFKGNPDFQGKLPKRVLLVDDFITSGSTVEKAASVLSLLNPEVEIHAASLGWKPKTGPQRLARSQRTGYFRGSRLPRQSQHRTALQEYQND